MLISPVTWLAHQVLFHQACHHFLASSDHINCHAVVTNREEHFAAARSRKVPHYAYGPLPLDLESIGLLVQD